MKSTAPPDFFLLFFRWFCHPKLRDAIEGDLMELYQERLKQKGKRYANRKFIADVLLLFRPGIIKPINKIQTTNQYAMLNTYFKIGWRNLVNQKMYSLIKIGGFAIGIAACLLISLYIKDELSYDLHYPQADRIYRVLGVINENGEIQRSVFFPAPLGPALKEDFPEVVEAGRYNAGALFGAGSNEVRSGDDVENSYDEGFTYFDQQLVNMLQLPFIYGNPTRALDQPNAIVITKRKADKYFPNENPLGKTLIINNQLDKPYIIGGVIEDFQANSHLQFDFLITTTGLEFWGGEQKDWGANNYPTYIMVRSGTDIVGLEQKITKGIIDKYYLPMMISNGMSAADALKAFTEKNAHLELQPLRNIHLSPDVQDGLAHGDMRFIWLFGGIAVFILLIAVINFVNLSTAKSANRAKEVGLRKVVGSLRGNIISQFLTESVLFSLISFAIGIALARVLLPYFNMLSAKALSFPWQEWWLLPIIALIAVGTGILAGIYPSFYLSSFRPIQVLKGNVSKGSKSSPLRSGLVIFQFTTSIVLIIGTMVIYRQMNFILNKKIGFEKDQVVLIQGANTLGESVKTFKDELLALPHVEHVSVSDYLPIKGTKRNGNEFWHEGKVNIDRAIGGQIWKVDHDYIETMGMLIAEGRDFRADMTTDSEAMIVNQKMARDLGGDVIGKRITNGHKVWTVIGVVEDFHFESLKHTIDGLCLVIGNSPSVIAVKVNSSNMSEMIQSVDQVWKKFAPQQPVRLAFLDERYAAMYDDVQRMGRIFTCFAVLAIVVACLGLFALSAFMAEQRAKEISIRLVLGASVKSVFRLLTINFITLVIISIFFAVPIAWYLMQNWLQDFAYRVEITWWIFAIAGALAMLIAMLTVSYQAIKAAIINPVSSLRSE